MGIPSYFSHIIRKYPNVLSKLQSKDGGNINDDRVLVKNRKVDRLYLDSNSIIYDSLSLVDFDTADLFEQKLINIVCKKIEEYISFVSPRKLVYIAFDGIAPYAKLKQQKNRRYKSWFMKQYDYCVDCDENVQYLPNKNSWDTSSITPGTKFMSELNLQVRYYFRNAKKFRTQSIIISGSDEPGEGEHKIMSHIRDSSNAQHDSVLLDNTFVYGLDADLIMLTLNHLKYCPDLYLFRETPEFIKSINSNIDPNENYVIDVDYLRYSINSCIYGYDIMEGRICCIEDYMFICFLLGNDFLPHFPALNIRTLGMDYVIETYRNVILQKNIRIITKNKNNENSINWRTFRLLVRELAKNEKANLLHEHKHRDKMERRIKGSRQSRKTSSDDKFEQYMMDVPLLERGVEKYINPFEIGWENRYYDMLCDIDVVELRKKHDKKGSVTHRNDLLEINEMCLNYLEGLEWTYNYYVGRRLDWSWSYRYNYAPLLQDLQFVVPYKDEEVLIEESRISSVPCNTEVEQLSYTLPHVSRYLLPVPLQRQTSGSNEAKKSTFDMQWAYCRYFWECHVLFK